MKVTLNWLREYVDFDWSAEELAERLTMLGLEVEGVERVGGEFAGVVVAQVLTRDKHPNADKLSVCRVHDGQGERQIVCGAQNFQPGDKVPLILPGSTLPPGPDQKEPWVIKVGRIRGVESQGMMCAAEELGVDPLVLGLRKDDGLLILKPDARVGQSFAEYLGRGAADVVYDLEVTPNRPDLSSVLGIARDVAALTGARLKVPPVTLPEPEGATADLISVRIDAADLCPRYSARVIRGVRIGPSPDWLRARLETVGLRSVNNVVDVTNFVMLETGQPLHAFDLRRIAQDASGRPALVIRRAHPGETFVTLDNRTHALSKENLLIADPEKGIALAGVMGGQNTEVSDTTQDILLESAYFSPTHVRRTSKSLGLRTDASYRFERGADPEAVLSASERAAQLIVETAGGRLAAGVVDIHPAPVARRQITLRHARVGALLGIQLRPEEIEFHLTQLGLRPVQRRPRSVDDERPPEPVTFEVPSHRVDLKREVDLIEEVARLYGVDRIPSTPPRHAQGQHAFDAHYDRLLEVRRLLTGLGLHEVQGQTLIRAASVRGDFGSKMGLLSNPLSSDMDALRPSLLPGLLDIFRHNLRHSNTDLALFEVGRVFARGGTSIREGWRLALGLTGARNVAFWTGTERGARWELADLKGLLEEFLEHLGVRGVAWSRRADPSALFADSAILAIGGKLTLGDMGMVQPKWARECDCRDPVLLAELDLDRVLEKSTGARSFQALPAFPAIRRDIALIVPDSVSHEDVVREVRRIKPAHLEAIELFDVFRGAQVPTGHKSVAYALTYRAGERTLTDGEVGAVHDRVVSALQETLRATVRA